MSAPAYPLRLPTRLPVLWRLMVLSLTLGALTSRLWAWSQGEGFGGVPTLVITAVAAPLVLLMYLLMPARAGEAGLRLFDGWGWPRRLDWDQIAEVRLARWPGLLYAPALALVSRQGRVHWLARDTQGLGELHALVLRRAGAAHPLVRALETPLHRL